MHIKNSDSFRVLTPAEIESVSGGNWSNLTEEEKEAIEERNDEIREDAEEMLEQLRGAEPYGYDYVMHYIYGEDFEITEVVYELVPEPIVA
jgi:coenzyme F420-reducing hydrogenase alpha subunit